MSSGDVSAPFRQALVAGTRHPVMFFQNFGPMVKAFGSERVYHGIMDEIASRPSFQKMNDSGLSLTELGPMTQREEQFVSNLAERINLRNVPHLGRVTGAKYATGPGDLVRASGRAYTGFLNKMRADYFDLMLKDAEREGRSTNDKELLADISNFVNSATGRGDLGMLREHAVTLNSVFFSPRLLASRLNFLNPVYYAKLDPFVRKEALKAAFSLVGTLGAVLELAKLGGAEVNDDPRNADFAKIKVGATRIDIAGGFQQPIRLIAQLESGKIVSSTTGKTLSLGPQGPGKLSRKDIIQRFLEQKLAPSPSFVNDMFKGTDFADKPFSWKTATVQRMIPLLAQDAADLYHDTNSLPAALGGYALGAFGVGIQTYGDQPTKSKTKDVSVDPFSVGGKTDSGTNPFNVP